MSLEVHKNLTCICLLWQRFHSLTYGTRTWFDFFFFFFFFFFCMFSLTRNANYWVFVLVETTSFSSLTCKLYWRTKFESALLLLNQFNCIKWKTFPPPSDCRNSTARTSLSPWKCVLDMDRLSQWGLIIAPSHKTNGDNLRRSFRYIMK